MQLNPVDESVRPDDRRWQEMANELQFNALAYVREAAERWTKTVGSITGAFGLLALFAGPMNIARSAPTVRILLGTLLVLTIIIGVAATLLAAQAAQGTPKLVLSTYQTFRADYLRQLEQSSRGLRRSRLLSLIGILPLVIAIGVSWYQPDADQTAVSITRTGEPEICVRLSPNAPGIEITAKRSVTIRIVAICSR
jgi:hypothetical protein